MGKKGVHILSLDEGTTSARAVIFNEETEILGLSRQKIDQIYPHPGWVEQNPIQIWNAQVKSLKKALRETHLSPDSITAIGVTNQRETTILWDKSSARPVYNAIVWQCRRTSDIVEKMKEEYGRLFKEKTGLPPDSYFSGPKIKWLLENVQTLRSRALRGEILFGTVDSYIIYRLTGGLTHVTDYSNASRTMLFNIHRLEWDEELLELLGIPEQILPEPRPSSEILGYTDPKVFGAQVPIAGDIGDQQAALFGQTAFKKGMTKCTYGTGNFLLMNTGTEPCRSRDLLTTIAWGLKGEVNYALEGSAFITGAAVQWLKNSLRTIKDVSETDLQASSLHSNEGVYFVPAFTGLGAPYWDQYARGMIIGLTQGTRRAHISRATLEAVAYITRDIAEAMEGESGASIEALRVDGGATRNDFLMQFQSDILGKKVMCSSKLETTALGAAYVAGLAVDFWSSREELTGMWKAAKIYEPKMDAKERERLCEAWKSAVERSRGWAKTATGIGWAGNPIIPAT
jgi:glycerol kinase